MATYRLRSRAIGFVKCKGNEEGPSWNSKHTYVATIKSLGKAYPNQLCAARVWSMQTCKGSHCVRRTRGEARGTITGTVR